MPGQSHCSPEGFLKCAGVAGLHDRGLRSSAGECAPPRVPSVALEMIAPFGPGSVWTLPCAPKTAAVDVRLSPCGRYIAVLTPEALCLYSSSQQRVLVAHCQVPRNAEAFGRLALCCWAPDSGAVFAVASGLPFVALFRLHREGKGDKALRRLSPGAAQVSVKNASDGPALSALLKDGQGAEDGGAAGAVHSPPVGFSLLNLKTAGAYAPRVSAALGLLGEDASESDPSLTLSSLLNAGASPLSASDGSEDSDGSDEEAEAVATQQPSGAGLSGGGVGGAAQEAVSSLPCIFFTAKRPRNGRPLAVSLQLMLRLPVLPSTIEFCQEPPLLLVGCAKQPALFWLRRNSSISGALYLSDLYQRRRRLGLCLDTPHLSFSSCSFSSSPSLSPSLTRGGCCCAACRASCGCYGASIGGRCRWRRRSLVYLFHPTGKRSLLEVLGAAASPAGDVSLLPDPPPEAEEELLPRRRHASAETCAGGERLAAANGVAFFSPPSSSSSAASDGEEHAAAEKAVGATLEEEASLQATPLQTQWTAESHSPTRLGESGAVLKERRTTPSPPPLASAGRNPPRSVQSAFDFPRSSSSGGVRKGRRLQSRADCNRVSFPALVPLKCGVRQLCLSRRLDLAAVVTSAGHALLFAWALPLKAVAACKCENASATRARASPAAASAEAPRVFSSSVSAAARCQNGSLGIGTDRRGSLCINFAAGRGRRVSSADSEARGVKQRGGLRRRERRPLGVVLRARGACCVALNAEKSLAAVGLADGQVEVFVLRWQRVCAECAAEAAFSLAPRVAFRLRPPEATRRAAVLRLLENPSSASFVSTPSEQTPLLASPLLLSPTRGEAAAVPLDDTNSTETDSPLLPGAEPLQTDGGEAAPPAPATGATGQVQSLCWSADGSALAVRWTFGGAATFSSFGDVLFEVPETAKPASSVPETPTSPAAAQTVDALLAEKKTAFSQGPPDPSAGGGAATAGEAVPAAAQKPFPPESLPTAEDARGEGVALASLREEDEKTAASQRLCFIDGGLTLLVAVETADGGGLAEIPVVRSAALGTSPSPTDGAGARYGCDAAYRWAILRRSFPDLRCVPGSFHKSGLEKAARVSV